MSEKPYLPNGFLFVDVLVKMSCQSLDHEKLEALLESCLLAGNYAALKQTLWEVFSNQECLANSWSKLSPPGRKG